MGLALKDIGKLRLVQNVVKQAHALLNIYYISPLKWHWLPVCFQMQFKVLVMTNKFLYSMGPDLSEYVLD